MKKIIFTGLAFFLAMSFCLIPPKARAQGCDKPACKSGYRYEDGKCQHGPSGFGRYRSWYRPSCDEGYDLDGARGVCVKRGECCEKPACKRGYRYKDGKCHHGPSGIGRYRSWYRPVCDEGWGLDQERGVCQKRDCGTSGMLIQRIAPNAASPGDIIEIHGIRFGADQGTKIVAINLGQVSRMQVLDWSDNLIRARIPNGLAPGSYLVLIYHDDTFRTGSNSLQVTVQGRR